MKRVMTILTALTVIPLIGFAQKKITFQVEELSKPETYLFMQQSKDIYEGLILSDVKMHPQIIKDEGIDFPFNIVAQSQLPNSIVHFGYHSFFNGMYQAYADHRPFVLSPDMIWLLISQGFARHVNANPEELRHYFVDFSDKVSLIVVTTEITLDNPNSPWEKVFPEFTKQIANHTGEELIDILSSDFTTTTPIEKVASEITIMEAMEPYFEFIIYNCICGIPEITLQGTPKDWQKIYDKTKQLSKYDLEWWTKELEPILKEFVKASKGKIDKNFWRNMFKYHSLKQYGEPKIIDGWIVKFFPYDKDGKRNNLKELSGSERLPEEIVKVDLKYIDGETGVTTPLELWAGFIGLEQNQDNFALTPKISWMIRKKDVDNIGLKQKLESDIEKSRDWGGGISIRVKEFPTALLSLKEVESVTIEFLDEIFIPDAFANVKVENLKLTGKITETEIARIIKMFPDSQIMINRKLVNEDPTKSKW
ncbi:MAG: DUF4419 domain-containing protein [Lentimicrobiaceae bacterium]|nr:DUF4419 domain-containing protein [Lentimicrobiaceae bacterium]